MTTIVAGQNSSSIKMHCYREGIADHCHSAEN